jgi:hypothetical protein
MPSVQPEQPRPLAHGLVFDADPDVLDPADHVIGESVEHLGHHALEVVVRDLDRGPILPAPGAANDRILTRTRAGDTIVDDW